MNRRYVWLKAALPGNEATARQLDTFCRNQLGYKLTRVDGCVTQVRNQYNDLVYDKADHPNDVNTVLHEFYLAFGEYERDEIDIHFQVRKPVQVGSATKLPLPTISGDSHTGDRLP